MAELLLGLPVAKSINERLAPRIEALKAAGVMPKLAIVRVGAREDDLSYERGALKRCATLGIEAEVIEVAPADATTASLVATLEGLNAREDVHGVLMFRPLPKGIDEAAVCAALAPEKDLDCMTPTSLLTTLSGRGAGFAPCTAEAVIELLDFYGVPLDGADVTVVGRSLVIGKPVSMMLQARNATVTMCHTHTADLAACCRRAQVVVAAAGHARTVGADAVREGQVIVDVGINWDEVAGKLVGDVDFDACEPVVASITPVPRGVGSVTTAVLAKHLVEAAERTLA
jgi:methylenetetrahydrofolate dehydrogenase (NADP+) / methenyltetrahydrofolate cyclohydrolase